MSEAAQIAILLKENQAQLAGDPLAVAFEALETLFEHGQSSLDRGRTAPGLGDFAGQTVEFATGGHTDGRIVTGKIAQSVFQEKGTSGQFAQLGPRVILFDQIVQRRRRRDGLGNARQLQGFVYHGAWFWFSDRDPKTLHT